MHSLNGKKILYIGPKFFGYENIIKSTLEEKFEAFVDFYDDRPSNDLWTKIFIRLKLKTLIKRKIDTYYTSIFNTIDNILYDYVFVVSPETLSVKELTILKNLQHHATFILYMWDSFDNKNSLNTIHLFDRVITFDNHDAKKYHLYFHPLFYIETYAKIPSKELFYDLCFIATAHSDRYLIAKKIEKELDQFSLKMISFLYLNTKLIYWGRRLFLKKYHYGPIADFSFEPMSQAEIISVISKSKAILDINHPSQVGLTMRTFEALGANKKLITTNTNIKQYDFYNANNITIIDRSNPHIDMGFFDSPYEPLDKEVYEKYSLYNWIITVFDCQSNK